MQQWCYSSLVTACLHIARVKPQRLLPLHSMAPRQVHGHHDSASAYASSILQAAAAASKQTTNCQFRSQHADQSVCKLLSTLRSHLQQQCRVNSSVSGSHSIHVPFSTLAYSTRHATQHVDRPATRLRGTMSTKLWRQSAASLAAKHSGETSLAPNLKELLLQSHTTQDQGRTKRVLNLFLPPSLVSQDIN